MAAPRKGNDAGRTLRYPRELKEPLALLAELNHRSVNDEIVIAIEEYLAKNAEAVAEMRVRRNSGGKKRR